MLLLDFLLQIHLVVLFVYGLLVLVERKLTVLLLVVVGGPDEFRTHATRRLFVLALFVRVVVFHEHDLLVGLFDGASVGREARLNVVDFLAAVWADRNVEHLVCHLIESLRVVQLAFGLQLRVRRRVALVEAYFLLNDEVVVPVWHDG